MKDLDKILQCAEKAAREAGEYILSRVDTLKKIDYKGAVNNLVTDVDKASEKMIIDNIKDSFPEHSILAEESGKGAGDAEHLWIIDPLDGTTNYAHGFPFYCVSIGVSIGGEVQVAAAYLPRLDEMFTAIKGSGAFLNGSNISVSSADALEKSLIGTGFAYSQVRKMAGMKYFERALERAQAVRRPGAAVIDLCYVACGRFDGFWEFGLHPWDVAAGQLIVKEAGGKVSMVNGDTLDIFGDDIVATNGIIHKDFLQMLNE